ncbi:MAG: tetraacyldisaccharide 4'-kinase [Gammaproteobacteria bacterium]|nr:tetraacyldisaccharide 4'-kinase [Gammaproteobacteria bacterium]
MFCGGGQLTLILGGGVRGVGFGVRPASRRFRRIARRIQGSMRDVTHVTGELVTGYRVVRIFGGEQYERHRFARASHANRRQNLKMVMTKVASTHVVQILVVAAVALLIALLARPEIAKGLSIGNFTGFLVFAGLLVRPVRRLTEINARLQRGLAAAEDVFGQLDADTEADTGTHALDRVQGRIEFRDVHFAYKGSGGDVLSGIDLTIEPGQTVAVVGRSGSGKSTLASLIPRFYDVERGEVCIDGTPVQDYAKDNLRRHIALVSQQVTLFNDTLAANIAYGSLSDSDPGAVDDAVRRAHADGFVERLPEGLNTPVGDDGVLLSGGQRQRVAIARALLKDAPILILDEATSALDSESERHIQAALDEVMRGRTTLVIAHRLSTVENADAIVVMDEGRIVETGTHESLLASGRVYASLHDAQFSDGEKPSRQGGERAGPPAARVDVAPDEPPRTRLVRAWYEDAWWLRLLSPLSWVFGFIAGRRRLAALTGKRPPWRAPVPVLVVGNLTVGGTGKTPLVIWLVRQLREWGLKPGVVSRGYGRRGGRNPVSVPAAGGDPVLAGDEPPLIAARTGAPVVVCRDRVKAVRHLIQQHDVNVVVSDDGLQHYALARDVEIAVIDGDRRFGNGRLLPSGPLREPASRLAEVDLIIANRRPSGLAANESVMHVRPLFFTNLKSGVRMAPDRFTAQYPNVNAVAGVGNPDGFAQTLRALGLSPALHPLDDHHRYSGDEVRFDNDWPVVCTEKDAVKLRRLDIGLDHCWSLEIETEIGQEGVRRLEEVLKRHAILS